MKVEPQTQSSRRGSVPPGLFDLLHTLLGHAPTSEQIRRLERASHVLGLEKGDSAVALLAVFELYVGRAEEVVRRPWPVRALPGYVLVAIASAALAWIVPLMRPTLNTPYLACERHFEAAYCAAEETIRNDPAKRVAAVGFATITDETARTLASWQESGLWIDWLAHLTPEQFQRAQLASPPTQRSVGHAQEH